MVSGNINRHRPSPSKNKMTENQPSKQNKILFSLARRSEKGQSRPKLLYPDKYHKNKLWTHPNQERPGGGPTPHPCHATIGQPTLLTTVTSEKDRWEAGPHQVIMRPPSPYVSEDHMESLTSTWHNKVPFPIPAIGQYQKRPSGVRPFTTAKQ